MLSLFNVTVARDTLGRPISVTYPSGMVVGINYSADIVSSMTVNSSSLLTNVAYRPQSQTATGWNWGNGTLYSRSFDADGRITAVSLGSVQRAYGYDAAGRITSQTDTLTNGNHQSSSFGYDEAGQLISYVPPTGASQAYTYDPSGNRHSQNSGTYTYVSNTNRLSRATTPSGNLIYQYNADGSPSTDGTFNYTYDVFGRLATAATSTLSVKYTYNALGMRSSKSVSTYSGGAWTATNAVRYVYDDQGELIGEYDSISGYQQETVWFNGQPVGMFQSGTLYYINDDNLGTPRSILRARDGAELWRWDGEPFGTALPTAPNPMSGTIVYNFRFPGQIYDRETGTHYNGQRDYMPLTGRYLEGDPTGLAGGINRYGYVWGNPLSGIDPFGTDGLFNGTSIPGLAGFGFAAQQNAVTLPPPASIVVGSGGVLAVGPSGGDLSSGGYLNVGTGELGGFTTSSLNPDGGGVLGAAAGLGPYVGVVMGSADGGLSGPFTNIFFFSGLATINLNSSGNMVGATVGIPGAPGVAVTNTNTVLHPVSRGYLCP